MKRKITRRLNESYFNELEFKAFITNLGKYNEGSLIGKWVEFPIDEDEFDEILDSIGISDEYEEWFVTDYDCNLRGFDGAELGEYVSYDELQELGELIEGIDKFDIEAIENAYEYTDDLEEAIEGIKDGTLMFYPDVNTYHELGEFYVNSIGGSAVIETTILEQYFDYEELGYDLSLDNYADMFSEDELEEMYENGDIYEPDEVDAGFYFCGNSYATNEQIGYHYVQGIGFDGISDIESYLDYDGLGYDINMQGLGMFTTDGYVEEV